MGILWDKIACTSMPISVKEGKETREPPEEKITFGFSDHEFYKGPL